MNDIPMLSTRRASIMDNFLYSSGFHRIFSSLAYAVVRRCVFMLAVLSVSNLYFSYAPAPVQFYRSNTPSHIVKSTIPVHYASHGLSVLGSIALFSWCLYIDSCILFSSTQHMRT